MDCQGESVGTGLKYGDSDVSEHSPIILNTCTAGKLQQGPVEGDKGAGNCQTTTHFLLKMHKKTTRHTFLWQKVFQLLLMSGIIMI